MAAVRDPNDTSNSVPEKSGILKAQDFNAWESSADSTEWDRRSNCTAPIHARFNPEGWTVRIEKGSHRGTTTIRLIGRFQSEHIRELEKQFEDCKTPFVLDLKEVTLVDVEIVRFLGACEADGMKIMHCSPYIREWIIRER